MFACKGNMKVVLAVFSKVINSAVTGIFFLLR